MRPSLIRLSSLRREISFLSLSISSLSRMRALMLFAATLRAWVREVCAREIVWMTAERTRRGQPLGRAIAAARRLLSIGASEQVSTQRHPGSWNVRLLDLFDGGG